jgi:hypothetical protein
MFAVVAALETVPSLYALCVVVHPVGAGFGFLSVGAKAELFWVVANGG